MNILEIVIEENNIVLLFEKDGKVIDEKKWNEKNDLSRRLLSEIDRMQKNNKTAIDKVEVVSDISEKFTTVRIAKTVAKAFNFAISQD